jgi:hypothetical protein
MTHENDLEISDDRHRGAMPHLQRAIAALRGLGPCYRCQQPSLHLIDAFGTPRAVCDRCAEAWRGLLPLQRMQSRQDYLSRGR